MWRKMREASYSKSGIFIAMALGIILGNVLIGMPIDNDGNYMGSTFDFLNIYALLVGVTTAALFAMHGAIYLLMKTEQQLYLKLTGIVRNTTLVFAICVLLLGFYTLLYVPHLLENIKANSWLFFIPIGMVLAIAYITRIIARQQYKKAFLSSAVVISLLLILTAVELYANLVLSSLNKEYNLTVANASSSQMGLRILLTIAAIGIPLVLFYTVFVYKTFRGKATLDVLNFKLSFCAV